MNANLSEVLLECKSTYLPHGLLRQIKRSLGWIGHADLAGIKKITLVDTMPDNLKASDGSISARGFYVTGGTGSFCEEGDRLPFIILSVIELYKWVPSYLWWSPLITLRITETLAHEVGHHVAYTRSALLPETSKADHELFANAYAHSVIQSMTDKWYYKIGQWLIKDLGDWYFTFGLAAARKGRYEVATTRFHAAWHLNPAIEKVADYYWAAREKSGRISRNE